MSSSSAGSLSSSKTQGTTESAVAIHPGSTLVRRRLSNLSPSSKKSLRRQICTVVHNLESVVSELNSVMYELHGVLEQIDRVAGCLDANLQGRLVYIQHSTESETLWRTRSERSFSSGCSLSSRNSKPSSSTSSSSPGSTDLSQLWKLSKEDDRRATSMGKQSHNRRSRSKRIAEVTRERRTPHGKPIDTENKTNCKVIFQALDMNMDGMGTEGVKLRDKKHGNNRAFLHGFCCVRTQSLYSVESEAFRSCHSDDGTWVLRKGNGIISPMYPYARLPVNDSGKRVESKIPHSLSESNISSCSSICKEGTTSELKLPKDCASVLNHTPIKTSGIESLTDGSLHSNHSLHHSMNALSDFSRKLEKSLHLDKELLHIPLMTYTKSPVDSARMHRDVFAETAAMRKDSEMPSSKEKLGKIPSCNRKPLDGIYQYESETDLSQKDEAEIDAKMVCTPVSEASVGTALSEIEPDTVETDYEVEFSLMPTIASNPCEISDPQLTQLHRDTSSLSLMQFDGSSCSFASLTELEEFKKRYRIDSYDSDASDSESSDIPSKKSKERELVAEGLKLLLYCENSNSPGDISEQKRKLMTEIDNLKLSFSSPLVSPDSDYGNIVESSPNRSMYMTPHSETNNLSDVFTLSSPGSSDASPSSNGFHSDPEVKAFLQELDRKVLARSVHGSIDNVSVFSGSNERLSVTDAMLARKLTQAVLDENSNIQLNSAFRSSMDSVLTDGSSNPHRSSDMGDSDHMLESFEWEHSFTFSMYQETGSKIPDFSPDADLTDKTVDSSFSQNFDLDEAMTYSLSYPLERAKSVSLSSGSFIWSEGSMTSDRRLDSTGKSVDELLSELDISTDLLSKSELKRPETLVPPLEKRTTDSLPKSEDAASDYKVGYNRDLNTWTAFAMVHIGGSDSNLSRCSVLSDEPPHPSGKSNILLSSQPDQTTETL